MKIQNKSVERVLITVNVQVSCCCKCITGNGLSNGQEGIKHVLNNAIVFLLRLLGSFILTR